MPTATRILLKKKCDDSSTPIVGQDLAGGGAETGEIDLMAMKPRPRKNAASARETPSKQHSPEPLGATPWMAAQMNTLAARNALLLNARTMP